MSSLHEECAVAGIIGDADAAKYIYLSLYALQHRGQEASGLVTLDDAGKMHGHKSFGLVSDVFTKEQLEKLPGRAAIGHNRYSTQGGRLVQNIQPFTFNTSFGPIAIAHNGNLTNAHIVREKLEREGSIFQSTSDTEVFMHLLAKSQKASVLERIKEVTSIVRGAYSLVILTPEHLYAVRDPFGFRPLVIGRREQATVVASETCALDLIGAKFVRDVAPGEIVAIDWQGQVSSHVYASKERTGFCAFEPVYFSRPDSQINGEAIYHLRKRMGSILARECSVPADVVIAVPDSGTPMALGYAETSRIPLELGLVRNHYVGRTFIEPSQQIRDFGVKLKLNPVVAALAGKRVVVVDDSIVRGTTSVKILRMIRQAGAKEIHMRVGSPPITHSCYFGVDTPERHDLLAAQQNVEEIRRFIGADTLGFLSLEGLREALGSQSARYCYGCFSGDYPEEVCRPISHEPTDDRGGPGLRAGF